MTAFAGTKNQNKTAKINNFVYNIAVCYRELHLHNNYLRVLPYDLGKLFHLQLLGLQGNPLSKEMLSIYNDNNGTAKLLTYLLDNLQGKSLCLLFVYTLRSGVILAFAHLHNEFKVFLPNISKGQTSYKNIWLKA